MRNKRIVVIIATLWVISLVLLFSLMTFINNRKETRDSSSRTTEVTQIDSTTESQYKSTEDKINSGSMDETTENKSEDIGSYCLFDLPTIENDWDDYFLVDNSVKDNIGVVHDVTYRFL